MLEFVTKVIRCWLVSINFLFWEVEKRSNLLLVSRILNIRRVSSGFPENLSAIVAFWKLMLVKYVRAKAILS